MGTATAAGLARGTRHLHGPQQSLGSPLLTSGTREGAEHPMSPIPHLSRYLQYAPFPRKTENQREEGQETWQGCSGSRSRVGHASSKLGACQPPGAPHTARAGRRWTPGRGQAALEMDPAIAFRAASSSVTIPTFWPGWTRSRGGGKSPGQRALRWHKPGTRRSPLENVGVFFFLQSKALPHSNSF